MRQSDKRIRVVFVLNGFLVGGAKKMINYFDLLPQSKFDIHFVTLFQFPEKREMYDLLPAHITVQKFDFAGFKDIRNWVQLIRYFRSVHADVVVSGLFFSNTVVRIVKLLVGYQVITMELNTYTDKSRMQILVDRILAPLSCRILAVSRGVADFTSAQARIPREKFVVIHNGVHLERIDTRIRTLPEKSVLKESLGFSATDCIILNVARLTPQKDHLLLLDSFARFHQAHPEYRLVILGEGGSRDQLEQKISALGLEERVQLAGVVDDVIPYYVASELFVSTSAIEGMSNAQMEAMACRLPVVATVTAGVEELLQEGKTGFLVQERSADGVATTLERALGANRDVIVAAAREHIEQFDIKASAQKYEALLEMCSGT